MKLVTALIRPLKLDEVRQALLRYNHVAAISDVKAFTPRREDTAAHGHAPNAFFTKVKIEVIVPSEHVARTIEILRHAASTGRLGEGDGLIFVTEVEHAVRIRTGSTDADAI